MHLSHRISHGTALIAHEEYFPPFKEDTIGLREGHVIVLFLKLLVI